MLDKTRNITLKRVHPWQRAFPNLWDGSDVMALALQALYERYSRELKGSPPPAATVLKMHGFIRRENLMAALQMAIESAAEGERQAGYTGDSALLAGWKHNLEVLVNHGKLEIRD
jgi:hypothetical protein